MAHSIFRWTIASVLSLLSTLALADPLQISLSKGSLDGTVNVELTNTGKETLSVLKWDTPFETKLSHDVFQVTTSAKALPFVDATRYIGRHAKRASPVAESFLTLMPGESRMASINLAEYYDIQQQDLYSVRFVGEIRHVSANKVSANKKHNRYTNKKIISQAGNLSALDHQSLISNELSIALAPQASSRILPPAYNGCSANQQSYIQSATQSAEMLTNTAVTDLQSLALDERATSPRYTTWFGTYSAERYGRVVDNFLAIEDALANKTIRYDCTCNEPGVFAYVYPVRPYNVFLCPAFHAAEELGTDSRAGTIIHELSHFNIVANTDDHVYSQQGAQSLANSDPARAIQNADSHEYFAENTPALAMLSDGTSPPVTQFTQLESNVPVTGTVSEGSADYYQISNATSVALLTNTGDADLYVYSDAQLTQLLCQSLNVSADDQCEVFNDGTLYIAVYGYVDSDYTLQVTGQSTEGPPETITSLMLDTPVTGFVAQDERIVYEVTGATLIELESITGDADLFIFSSTNYNESTLLCSSILESPLDTCALPDADSTYYVMLVGWLDSDYSLTATVTEIEPEIVLTAFGELIANEQVSRSIEERAVHTYTATGITVFELTSLTGDADLLIFDGPIDDGGELICVSEEFSSDAILDRCDVSFNSSSMFEVAVFGYTASDYTLVGVSDITDPVTPPNDGPDPGQPIDPPTPPVDNPDPVVPTTPPSDNPDPTNPDPIVPTIPTTPPVAGPELDDPNPVLPVNPVTPADANTGGSSGGGSMGMHWLVIGLSIVGFRYRRRLMAQA